MNILLIGKGGQVGWELQRSLAALDELIGLDSDSTDFCGGFTDPEGLADTRWRVAPDMIVDAGAAPGMLAREDNSLGAWLAHYSIAYRFDGGGARLWREEDVTGLLGIYVAAIPEGEQAIHTAECGHLIMAGDRQTTEYLRPQTVSLAGRSCKHGY